MPTDTIDPEVLERIKSRNPTIILNYLLQGREWERGGYTYVLSEDYELCQVAYELDRENGVDYENFKDGKRRYLKTGMSLQYFLKMAMDTSIDDVAIMAAELALQDINRSKR